MMERSEPVKKSNALQLTGIRPVKDGRGIVASRQLEVG
jgi:hypothetical protein